jgi:hypothetical protein
MEGLKGKRVLVTGGSSGIGQACAVRFAKHGSDVAINYLETPEEAAGARLRLRTRALDVTDRRAALELLASAPRDRLIVAESGVLERAHAAAAELAGAAAAELAGAGIVLRDLDRGLVDFPAIRDGEEVYLCWLVDEPEIEHWHELDAGFAGRRRLAR